MKRGKLLSVIGLFLSINTFSQTTVLVVEPDAGASVGALNAAITANQGNVIYGLKRDAVYYINGLITTSFPLHIRAQAGTGKRPILQPATDANGASTRIFSLGGNTKLEGLCLSGRDDMNNLLKNVIRVEKEGVSLQVTDCFFDYDGQCPMRLQVSNVKVYVKDCIFRNIINVNEPNDGKLVDTRGNMTDSICFDNNTIYHTGHLFARIDGAFVNYMRFDHNTAYVTGDGFDLSKAFEVEITNNMLYNINWQGSDITAGSSPEAFIKMDSIILVNGKTDAQRAFKITNNNVYTEKKYIDSMKYGKFIKAVFATTTCGYFVQSGQMDTTNNIHESIVFDNPPPAPMAYIVTWHKNNGVLLTVTVPNFYADKELNVVGGENDYSFNYYNNTKSATGSTTRGPIGSTRWKVSNPVGINDNNQTAVDYKLFPNPTVGKIFLTLNVDQQTSMKLSLFDMLGKQVKSFNFSNVSKSNNVEIDVSDIPVGVYVINYQLGNGLRGSGKLVVKK